MRARLTLAAVFLLGLVLAAVLAITGILPRVRARQMLQQQTHSLAEPVVAVVKPQRQAATDELVLPGNVQAYTDAPIYARSNGYLKRWYFDIGSRVRAGQLLAEIESPETDQQLAQAREELATAQANLKLAEITAARYRDLLRTDSVSKQEVDNVTQDAAAKAAAVKSSEANVRRLEQVVGFEKLYAPFDGVVTARNTDLGQLIAAGPSGGQSKELFHVAAIDRLRVYVNVPQVHSHEMRIGSKPELVLPELPNQRFPGTLVRTADAMDPATRTLLIEVDVPNRSGLLMPNAYAEVHFSINAQGERLLIPTESLLFRSEGLRVPVVVEGNKVALVPVKPGRDFGKAVEVLGGLDENTRVIADPPDSLVDGEVVRIAQPKPNSSERPPNAP